MSCRVILKLRPRGRSCSSNAALGSISRSGFASVLSLCPRRAPVSLDLYELRENRDRVVGRSSSKDPRRIPKPIPSGWNAAKNVYSFLGHPRIPREGHSTFCARSEYLARDFSRPLDLLRRIFKFRAKGSRSLDLSAKGRSGRELSPREVVAVELESCKKFRWSFRKRSKFLANGSWVSISRAWNRGEKCLSKGSRPLESIAGNRNRVETRLIVDARTTD